MTKIFIRRSVHDKTANVQCQPLQITVAIAALWGIMCVVRRDNVSFIRGEPLEIPLNPTRIRAILEGYLTRLPDGIEFKVSRYLELLVAWGEKVPLTSLRDPEEIVRFHFGESIFAASLMEMVNGRLADVGTGAGFPGLAIRLANPALAVTLIEPSKKKAAFLHEVIRSLDLNDTEVLTTEFEHSPVDPESLSYVTSRATGQYLRLLDWAATTLAEGGAAVLWLGGDGLDTITAAPGWSWAKPSLIPETRRRFIVVGKKSP
jgi:16S rRNA (guanine527-N7)-methyltransferase